MARIGLRYPCYKGAVKKGVIAKAIQADVAITMSDGKLYADDVLIENDNSFQSGNITLNIDDLSAEMQTEFLGHAKNATTEEITANVDDISPFVGIGFYGVKMKAGVRSYRALWFPKVKFAEPSDSLATKGQSLAFGTDSIVGEIYADDAGDWKKEQTFATEALAKTYIEGKAGITV